MFRHANFGVGLLSSIIAAGLMYTTDMNYEPTGQYLTNAAVQITRDYNRTDPALMLEYLKETSQVARETKSINSLDRAKLSKLEKNIAESLDYLHENKAPEGIYSMVVHTTGEEMAKGIKKPIGTHMLIFTLGIISALTFTFGLMRYQHEEL